MERLQKVLAHAGIGSRRACEDVILQGRVTVDGQVVRELGTRVDPHRAKIAVDGEPIRLERMVYYAVNKPKGYVSTNHDPSGRPRVVDLLPEVPQRVYTVGRLDEMSTGLMLLTNDGELANRLAHPKFGVEKLYRAVVAGSPDREILTKLTEGIWLAEGKVRAKRVRVVGRKGEATVLEMVLAEGKNREVRRMLARLGHKVMTLTRVAVGPITLKGLAHRRVPSAVFARGRVAAQGRRGDRRHTGQVLGAEAVAGAGGPGPAAPPGRPRRAAGATPDRGVGSTGPAARPGARPWWRVAAAEASGPGRPTTRAGAARRAVPGARGRPDEPGGRAPDPNPSGGPSPLAAPTVAAPPEAARPAPRRGPDAADHRPGPRSRGGGPAASPAAPAGTQAPPPACLPGPEAAPAHAGGRRMRSDEISLALASWCASPGGLRRPRPAEWAA